MILNLRTLTTSLVIMLSLGASAHTAQASSSSLSLPLQGTSSQPQDLTLEPAFWWAGMHNPELQLILYSRELPSLPQQLKVDIQGQGINCNSGLCIPAHQKAGSSLRS